MKVSNISSKKDLLKELEDFRERYSNLPFEAILKQDILRQGIQFDPASLQGKKFKKKDYFIFTFDHVALEEQSQSIRFQMPEEIRIKGGHWNLLPTIVSVRNNSNSPYIVKNHEDYLALFFETEKLADIELPPIPEYYRHSTKAGKSPGEIAPVIEWGYLIYLTVFRNCQYFGREEECAFCDINHNYRQQKNQGRPYTGVKSVSEILEVLSWIDKEDSTAKTYTITGGSVTKDLRGKSEMDFYYQYVQAIEERFPNRWLSKIVTQAWEKEDLLRFRDTGVKVYHPNYEIWDPRLFSLLCPGKERYIGREKWIRRILEAVDVFGHSCVIPNFVAGVELAKPHGFSSVSDAIDSTKEGIEFFMSHGVVPRFTTWCPEPFTTLAEFGEQTLPPLVYFLELLSSWKAIFESYRLPVPPGYGSHGPGQAVFSVSAFMDIIGYQASNPSKAK